MAFNVQDVNYRALIMNNLPFHKRIQQLIEHSPSF